MTSIEYADHVPMNVLLPDSVAEPVVIYEPSAALRFAVAERDHARSLGTEFDEPGNYILLDPIREDGMWGVYVGKASPGGVKSRLMNHLSKKDDWSRVVIIQRDTTHGFNSAQVGWLEGRLYDLMQSAQFAELSNKQRPSDETLPIFERNMLEATILPIRRLLRLLGYDPASADDAVSATDGHRSRQPTGKVHHGISLAEIVAAELIEVGARLGQF